MSQTFKTLSLEELDAMNRKQSENQAPKTMNEKSATSKESGFVNADELLSTLFKSVKSRPSARWLRDRTQAGDIPSVKIGGLTFYDVSAVRAALNSEPESSPSRIAAMGETELWAQYGKLLETKGACTAREFYKKNIEDNT